MFTINSKKLYFLPNYSQVDCLSDVKPNQLNQDENFQTTIPFLVAPFWNLLNFYFKTFMQNSNAYLHKCEHFQIFFNNTVVDDIVKCLTLINYFPHWRFVYNYVYKFGRYFLFIKQVLYYIRNTLQTKLFDRNKERLTFFLYVIWKQMKTEYNDDNQ